jgi:REP element-mobilizing transposase RayT/DNA-binding NarL/FixJ family response regulator
MAESVLIVTSSPGIGEVVRRTLVESGRYEVVLSTNPSQGIWHAKVLPFSLAILDVDLARDQSGISLRELGSSLREINPGIHILALSGSNDPYDPNNQTLAPEGIITTPLYPSSILRIVDRVAGIVQANLTPQVSSPDPAKLSKVEQTDNDLPAWLQDVSRAAQHLTRLSLETASQAALIVSEDRLWAYAGELPQPAAQELAETVVHYWRRNGESDLARFVQLNSDGNEYLLYATALGSGMVLALVFGVETPFSKIRSQVVNLARLLSTPPVIENEVASPAADLHRLPRGEMDELSGGREEIIDDRPLFSDIPSPSPETWQDTSVESGWVKTQNEGNSENLDSAVGATPSILRIAPGATASELEDWKLVTATAGMYNLTYGILLVPRLPDHYLVGDLADRLPKWVSQLCIAFDWRLEHISIRPDYLQWNASATAETPPAQMVRNIRKHTSQRIFDEFPTLRRENPSGEFWATGFLLVTGSQPPPGQLVQEFIRQTRNRQGISRPLSRQNR